MMVVTRRRAVWLAISLAFLTTQALAQDSAKEPAAQETVKLGLLVPMTGPFAPLGKEILTGARLYMQQNGDVAAGKKIELVVRDDAGVADQSKRLAQEMIVNDKVKVVTGLAGTAIALAVGKLAAEAKVPGVIMGSGSSVAVSASPMVVRTSYSSPQVIVVSGEYFAKSGVKTVVTIVSDYTAGAEIETWFNKSFEANGGKVLASLRVPLANPDFAPTLQRAADQHPQAIFIFVPASQGATLMRQFDERGLKQAGIKLLGDGGVLDEYLMDEIGDSILGVQSAFQYSDAHPSELNRKFVAGFEKLGGIRPNFQGVGAYDGMALIYRALEKTRGDTDGTALFEAMKGQAFESPRGPISIDPQTREIVQNVYMRRVEKVDGHYKNIEFETFPNVKDPSK
jgi:branched-chain amino acid transport system substrate-binding protein